MQLPEQDGDTADLLKAGIRAARQGDKQQAHDLLLQVIERDQRNEQAWLWLSGVVESDEDRLICLENVLAINPDSDPAKKGLARLTASGLVAEPLPQTAVEDVVRVERPPISPAAAVLYPERQVMELPWEDKGDLQAVPAVTYESHTVYDDIWERDSDICAFCAAEVAYDDRRCPQCSRKLSISHFLYPKASGDLMVYFVLLLGASQLFFIHALVDLILQTPLLTAVWHIVLFSVLFVLSGAIIFRRFWAYTASVLALVLIFGSMILDAVANFGESGLAIPTDGVAYFSALAENPFVTFISPIFQYLVPFQMLAIFLALVYGIFKVGPDFERVNSRLTAQVDKRLKDSSAFYAAGKRLAGEGMWASAVLHFQRAAAHEPNRAFYHLAAGKAFARLGFKQRAADAFASAQRLATNEELKAEIELAMVENHHA